MTTTGSIDPDPEQSLDRVVRPLLLEQFQRLEQNEPGILSGEDSEPLHDFRVALRRTRTLLGQFEDSCSEALRPLLGDFSWLGQVTGPSRDIDVLLQEFPMFLERLSPEAARNLGVLQKRLCELHQGQIQDLTAILSGKRYQGLKTAWRAWLDNMDRPLLIVPCGQSTRDVVFGAVDKAFERVLTEGSAIQSTSPDEDLHRLRKSCKKLRYLLEFFGGFCKGTTINAVLVELKKLQDNLGSFQDFSVQPLKLREVVSVWSVGGQVPVATLIALELLLEQVTRQKEACRDDFAEHFKSFVKQEDDHCWRKRVQEGMI